MPGGTRRAPPSGDAHRVPPGARAARLALRSRGLTIERRVCMEHGREHVVVELRARRTDARTVRARDWSRAIRFRPARRSARPAASAALRASPSSTSATRSRSDGYPPLRMGLDGLDTFTIDRKAPPRRALPPRAQPRLRLGRGAPQPRALSASVSRAGSAATFFASAEPWTTLDPATRAASARRPRSTRRAALARVGATAAAREGLAAHLVLAADQFLIDATAAPTRGRRRARATTLARSSPATTGSPTGVATR